MQENDFILFRSLDFYQVAYLVDLEEVKILLNPEQHNLLILLSSKNSGQKYLRIKKDLFLDLLEMYNF